MFDSMIEEKGMNVLWQEAMACYCLSEETGQPDFNCPKCFGSGYIYSPNKETKVLVSGLSGKFDFSNIGMVEKGVAYATSFSWDLMGYHDRLVFPDFNCKYSQVITFNNGKSTKLHKPAKKIIRCLTSSVEYISFEISNEDSKLIPDFKISTDGYYLEWLNLETYISDGTRASILYITSPSYIIEDMTHELRATFVNFKHSKETFKELPKQYSLKREDFIYEQNNNKSTSEYY